MLVAPKRLGSARVLAGNFRRPGRKTLFGETPNTTREDAYAPQTYPEPGVSSCLQGFRRQSDQGHLGVPRFDWKLRQLRSKWCGW